MHPPIEKVCASAGLDDRDARVLQVRVNTIYALPHAGAVVRLHHLRHPKWTERLRAVVAVTRWLAARGFPTIVPLDVEQPIEAGEWTATVWRLEHVAATAAEAGLTDLAPVLHDLHALPEPPFAVPETEPLASLPRDIERAAHLPGAQRAWLTGAVAAVQEEYGRTELPLGRGLVHGDAHPGNLFHAGGRRLLGDWDSVSRGPVAHDLVPVLDGVIRFGRPWAEWAGYCAAYGVPPDIADHPGMRLLQRMRELRLLAPCLRGAADPGIRAELDKRLRTLMYGGTEVWRSL